MMISIVLPEEYVTELLEACATKIEYESNYKKAVKVSDIKVIIKKAWHKAKGIKRKVVEFQNRAWIKRNLARYV